MAKGQKGGDFKDSKSEPQVKKPLTAKGADTDVNVKTAELEKDELSEFKAAKKAEAATSARETEE